MPVFHDMLSSSTVKVGRGRKQSSCPLKSSWKRGHTLYRKTAPTQGPSHTPMKVKMKSLSRVRLFATRWTVAYQAPPSMGFSRQEYWSGLPFPSPGDLPDPGIEPGSPTLQADALSSEPPKMEDYRGEIKGGQALHIL